MELNYNQLLQFFVNRRPKEMDKLLSISLSRCPALEEAVDELSEDLQIIFYTLFTKQPEQKPLDLRAILPLKQHKTAMPVCNKLLVVNEAVYKCYNCTGHESAVLCIRCFERGNHQGHRFSKIDSGGGNCDCGNPDAILESGFCVDHKGKADEMVIDEAEEEYFRRFVVQIFIWVLRLHQLSLKKEAELLLTHLVDVLDWLNNESLYYNTLTNKVLFNWENQMIDHILIMGSANGANILAKKATELFLKMFSLEIFKENLAIAYLRAYNRLAKFEETKFESLFIQLFANNDLVEKIVEKSKISLDPREREYNPNNYYGSLLFVGTIKERAARAFFTPIIEKGGVHCMFMDQVQKCVQFGTKNIEEIYSEYINVENLFYSVYKVVVKLFKNTPEMLEMELRNQYNSILKNCFTKNKVVLVYHRVFVMLVFVYFKCDYEKIDLDRLREILRISILQMKDFLRKMGKCFLYCLKEYGKCIGNSGFGRYSFENYVDLYCRSSNGNKIIMLDMIGIKFCSIALKENESFSRVMVEMLNEEANKEYMLSASKDDWEDDDDEEEGQAVNPKKPKSTQSAVIFYLGWLNTISIFIETIIYDRSEVALTNQLEINDDPAIVNMYQNQFKKLMLNVRQMTMHEIESMGVYWFSKPIDKAVIAKYASFDRVKKKFVIKEDVNGVPVKRELLKSFTKAPDHYLRGTDQLAMEITDKIRKWRELFFPQAFIQKLYKTLAAHLRSSLSQEFQKFIKQLANNLRIMNMLFQSDNQSIEDLIDLVIALASDNKRLKAEISAVFQTEKKQVIEEEEDKDKNEKRRELLKKKKQEKLKNFKNKQNVDKFLSQNDKQIQNENNKNESCIICHECTTQKPLYYLASTFSSNIVYSILSTEGINPFFLSCFHHVHEQCFLSIAKDKQKIFCPLCKAMTNIIIPTEQNMKDEKVLSTAMERINILFAMEYRQQFKNIYVEIMKSFIQLFFSGTIEEGLITERQIKLFKLILELCKQKYKSWSEEQKVKYINELLEVSSKYEKTSKTKYNIGLLIDFVLMIASQRLKDQELTQQFFKEVISHCRNLPKTDMNKCISLAQKVFDVNYQFNTQYLQIMEEESNKQLKQFIYTFDPPKTIRALLQQRKQIENQNICKLGHNICICLICSWKGCFDCNACLIHTSKIHNSDSLYFNFITGGFYHHYNGIIINIRSLYVNDLGVSWKPKYEEEAFYFEIDMYQKMVQALKSGNLIQMIRSNYEYLKIPENNSIWNL